MKNILIISHFSGSGSYGMVYRNYLMAKAWVAQGHKVTILASSYSHYRQTQPKLNKGDSFFCEEEEDIEYIWVKTPKYQASNPLGRVLNMLSFTFKCYFFKPPLDKSYEIIIASSPHPFSILPAYKLSKKYRAKLIYDIRDLWPLTLKMLGGLSDYHPLVFMMNYCEKFACTRADLITSVPQNAASYLAKKGLPSNRFLAVPNGVDQTSVTSADIDLPILYKKKLKDIRQKHPFLLVYTGALGVANAMSDLLHAMVSISNDVGLLIVGDGAEKKRLEEIAEKYQLTSRVHFLSPINKKYIPSLLSYADCAYAGLNNSKLYKYGASLTKLNDYMLAGIPIIYAACDKNNSVEISESGVVCQPGNVESIAKCINEMAQLDQESRAQMGERGKRWCTEKNSFSQHCKNILVRLDNLPPRRKRH